MTQTVTFSRNTLKIITHPPTKNVFVDMYMFHLKWKQLFQILLNCITTIILFHRITKPHEWGITFLILFFFFITESHRNLLFYFVLFYFILFYFLRERKKGKSRREYSYFFLLLFFPSIWRRGNHSFHRKKSLYVSITIQA